ncbi:hypothetical protein GCM10010172_79190 [Paractinoplanes ferrugineus]|uniref:Uncharacterized protein n=1 Tax=Paractinoplanes ferrugineus TaxID=113564 RepID=A0A919MEP7_9ACTN|nr:hypothetical protein [Actinoplanes ferrugineus]GIE12993.1 hypothetical protein Afe05nite_48330 [Actinoplanes ferrugineus]
MRWLTLYLRSRGAPAALTGAVGCTALMWTLWSVSSKERTVGVQMVVLTVLFLVALLTASFGGPDDALDRTAALRWAPRRAAHLLAAVAVVVGLLLLTLGTDAGFGPAWLVVRDAGGLLGLTALGAVVLGPARSWFLPLGWTLPATMFPQSEPLVGRVLTWQTQEPASTAAAVLAGVLALAGLVAYASAGPAPRAPAEA